MLTLQNFKNSFVIEYDASGIRIGAVLLQKEANYIVLVKN